MDTPIYDFLKKYSESNTIRLHMPGHKGRIDAEGFYEASKLDITEIKNADVLFSADGIIQKSEENLASLYDTKFSCYSTGGSTLCIQTMLKLFANDNDIVIAGRNAHVAFINACALLNLNPKWVMPKYIDELGVSGEITAQDVEKAIHENMDAKLVYITSPDYLGVVSDIKNIAEVCHKYGLPLLVDNAHGAYLKFLENDNHPITLGADACCDSAHKTLPVLTGGAYIHISKNINITKGQVKNAMALFGSTSPSYLILASMDICNKYLYENAKFDFEKAKEKVDSIRTSAKVKGFTDICYGDYLKLTLRAADIGWNGYKMAEYFRENNIECEYSSDDFVVFMFTPQNSESDFAQFNNVLKEIEQYPQKIGVKPFNFTLPKLSCNVRKAVFSERENIPVEEAKDRVAAENKIICPPGVPVVVAGEIISEKTQKLLKISSISTINVLK